MSSLESICPEVELFVKPAGIPDSQDARRSTDGRELACPDLELFGQLGASQGSEDTNPSAWGSSVAFPDLELFGSPTEGQEPEVSKPGLSSSDLEIFARPGEAPEQEADGPTWGAGESICAELDLFVKPADTAGQQDSVRSASRAPGNPVSRVCGFDSARVEFSEELQPRIVSTTGACLSLQHEVYADDTLRIINLETYFEADFRVVGPTRMDGPRVAEWAVESQQKGRSIWNKESCLTRGQPSDEEAGILLQCRSCNQEILRGVTPMEAEALNSTGIIAALCDQCNKATYWTYADPESRPKSYPPFAAVAPPPRVERVKKFVNTRAHKRLRLDLPVLVRDQKGNEELARTENVSIGGFAVILSLDLAADEIVTYVCPYAGGIQMIEQKAECRWSASASSGGVQRIYGFRRMG